MVRRSSRPAEEQRARFRVDKCAAMLALLSLAAVRVFALDPNRPLSQYIHRTWQMQHGLPQDSVLSMAQTPDRYLWIGTWNGLARFDGANFTVFDTRTLPEMQDGFVRSLYVRRSGELWIGTGSGILVYAHGRFRALPLAVAGGSVTAMTEDDAGTMWVAMNRVGIMKFDGREFVRVQGDFSSLLAFSLYASGGDLWIGTTRGLDRLRNGRVEHFREAIGSLAVYAFARDPRSGHLFIGTSRGLFAFDGQHVTPAHPELADDEIGAAAVDGDGNVWLGTRNGIKRLRDGRVTVLRRLDGTVDDIADTLVVDFDGNLWAGMRVGGLVQFTDRGLLFFGTQDGLSSQTVWAVAADPDGTIWAATEKGLDRLEGDRWANVTLPSGHTAVMSLLAEKSGLWIGTYGAGLLRRTKGGVERFLTGEYVYTILRDRAGSLWAGSFHGVHCFDGKRWKRYTTADGLDEDEISAILEDRRGRIWVASGSGVNVLRGNRFESPFAAASAFPRQTVWGLREDSNGDIWIMAHRGLYRIRGETIQLFGARQGLVPGDLGQMLESPRDVIWLTTLKGIARLDRRQLDRVARGASPRVDLSLFDGSGGTPQTECSFGSPPVAHDGRIWFATTRGVAALDPDVRRWAAAKPLHESVVIDSVRHSPEEKLSVGPEIRRIEFHYTSATFASPERVRFRYRLDGFDRDWVDVGTRRIAYYTRLPAGDYRFRVEAAGSDGRWIEAAGPIPLEVLPPFHRRSSFVALCAGVLLILAWGIHALRVRRLALEHRAVLDERLRIARELHDTVARRLTGVALQLDVATSMLDAHAHQEAREQVTRARKTAARGLADTREALFRLRSETVESSSLPAALERVTTELTAQSNVRAEISIVGAIRRLRGDVESELLQIAEEAIANALRHAAATRISITLEMLPREVRLKVSDDGQGSGRFQLEDIAAMRYGVVGMLERAKQIVGSLIAHSVAGCGTEITVEVRA